MTSKRGLQSRQQRHPLFAQCGDIAANASKGVSPSQTAEAVGDFLLHLDHAQIFQKGKNGFLLFAQAIKQVVSVTLFAATPSARLSPRQKMCSMER